MLVDRQTLHDLGVLHPQSEQSTVFDWANFTCTTGGDRLLRERFQEPLTSALEIRQTQEAVIWLGDHADLFDPFLSRGAWLSMERYLTSSVSPLDQLNRFVLWIDSYWIRYLHADVYREVLAALSLTQTLVRSAAGILTDIESIALPAILSDWVTRLRRCVEAPAISRLISSPDADTGERAPFVRHIR